MKTITYKINRKAGNYEFLGDLLFEPFSATYQQGKVLVHGTTEERSPKGKLRFSLVEPNKSISSDATFIDTIPITDKYTLHLFQL